MKLIPGICSEKIDFSFSIPILLFFNSWEIKRYIITTYDYFHKLGYAKVYKSASSLSTFDFLLRLNLLVGRKIAAILSDNGSEFAEYFEEACKKLNVTHLFTRVRTPPDNPMEERFNRTLKEELMDISEYFEEYLTQDDLSQANKELTDWLIFYNFKRPHQAFDYQTAIEYILSILTIARNCQRCTLPVHLKAKDSSLVFLISSRHQIW